MLFLSACSFKPVVDTNGRSGSFDKSKSNEITNDLQHCKTLAKENTNSVLEGSKYVWNWYFRPGLLFIVDKAEYNYPKYYRKCLEGRGHSVIN